ncbi:MAG TPA: aspartyl protease family protein, partial [Candidatus Paceibacterota bacterium]|nr:aspartyl protease family protein [Candidatus Paceibacterota bacterium]
PYITIYIHNGTASIPIEALVDSGSDGMVIHAGLAKDLGIDSDKCPRKSLGGATGLKEGFTADVSYEVDGFPKETIETKAIFIPDLPVACLVGQEDLFKRFIVQFEKSNNVLKLSKVSK